MSEIEKGSISRRDFLRAAGTLGISGGLLGAYAGQALGHNGEDRRVPRGRRGGDRAHELPRREQHCRERGHLAVRPE